MPEAPQTPRRLGLGSVDGAVADELECIFEKHERAFAWLLLGQLVVEMSFNVVYVYYGRFAVRQLSLVYHAASMHTLWMMFWGLYLVEMLYVMSYYMAGVSALWRGKPQLYQWFADVALVGLAWQVVMAYMNKFNLLVFILRMLAYVYARFMRNMVRSLSLLPVLAEP